MQRFLLSLLIILGSSSLFAQSVEDIEKHLAAGALDKAKESVDGFLAKEKNAAKADGWWYKGVVYNEMAKSDKYKAQMPEARMDAFNAFKKYYEMEPKAVRATLEQHVRLFDIYNGYFDLGVKSFGEGDEFSKQKKEPESVAKFGDAYTNFKNALAVEEYISGKGLEYNGFKFPTFDTTLHQNIALSAYRAKKFDDAADYNKKIADQKIASKDNIDAYKLLVDYYSTKGDKANKDKYLELGRQLFPEDDFWYQVELEEVNEKDKKALFAKYAELMPKYPDKYLLSYNYGVELFNYAYAGDSKPADYKETQGKIESVLKQTMAAKKDYPEAYVLMSRHYYNVLYDYQDEMLAVKGTTPADKKKKDDLKVKMTESADQLITYSQAAYDLYAAKPTLKAGEKGNLKVVSGYLSTAYEVKGDKVKSEEYRKKSESN